MQNLLKHIRYVLYLLFVFSYCKNYSQNLTSSLTACYSLDGNALDPISNLNGTVTSAVTPTVNRFGAANSAYYFNGSASSYIELPDDPLLKPANAISFAVWLKPNSNGGAHIIYTRNNLSSNFEAYQLCVFTGAPVFRLNKSSSLGNNIALSSTTVTPGTWYHLACTIDNSSVNLYLNGVLQGSATTTFSGFDYMSGKKVYLGDSHETFSYPYNGSMDNLRFYNRTLTAAEVSLLYTSDPTCVTMSSVTIPTSASFTTPDTVCVGQTFTLQNTSTGSVTSNYWNACSNTVIASPSATNIGNPNTSLNGPVFMSVNKDGSTYYKFVTNNTNGTITRINYGSSLNNSPISTSVIATGLSNIEGIHIEKEGSNWYGIVVGGLGSSYIARLSFGTSLANTPTLTNMGNIGGLSYPVALQIFRENSLYYGLTINYSNSTLTRFDFGSSLSNVPSGVNLGNIGSMSGPGGMAVINYANAWYAFITNDLNSTLTRLSFGNSLVGTPSGTNIGNPGGLLNAPRGISLHAGCTALKGLISNSGNNTVLSMDFATGPAGSVTLNSLGNLGSLSFPASIYKYRIGDSAVYFLPNASSNSITRLHYSSCTSIPSSTLQNPAMTFPTAGNYTISLECNEGLYDQSSYCKTIYVQPTPSISVSPNPAALCIGGTATLTAVGAQAYTWQPGNLAGISVNVSPTISTTYTVFGNTTAGCSSTSTLGLVVSPTISVNASSNPASVCPGNSATLSAGGATTYTWIPGNLTGSSVVVSPLSATVYTVTGSTGGCSATASTSVSMGLALTVLANGNLCNNTNVDLSVSPTSTATGILWTGPGIVGSNSNATISVNSGGIYTVVVTNTLNNCSGTGTINVFSNTNLFSLNIIPSSTVTCFPGPPVNLLVSASASLTWFPSSEVSPNTGALVSVSPSVSSTYTVIGTLGSCSASAAITISVNAQPSVSLSADNFTVCSLSSVSVIASGATDYNWLPGNLTGDTVALIPYASTIFSVMGANGLCTDTKTLSVNVIPTPSLILQAAPATICIGNTSTLSVSGASSYTWQASTTFSTGTSIVVNPTVTTIYTVTGTNSLNCSSTANIQLTVINSPAINANASSTEICAGESVTLTASGAGTYTWFPGFLLGSTVVTSPSVSVNYTVNSSNTSCSYATVLVTVINCVNNALGLTNAAGNPEPSQSNYYKISFTITAGNNSNSGLTNLELNSDLKSTFPFPASYTITGKPKLLSVNSALSLNANFDGRVNTELTNAGASSLAANKRDTLSFELLLEPNGYTGLSRNSVVGKALDKNLIVVSDSSNAGFLWDPDGDGNPANNNELTVLQINPLELFIPEGFSPNNDGFNDRFMVSGLNGRSISLSVFNRWGNKVFEDANYLNTWEGVANVGGALGNGKLPQSTYYYVIDFNDGNGKTISGFVVLEY